MSFAELTGSVGTITIANKEYKLSLLRFKEIGEYCFWLQYKDYEDGKRLFLDKDHLREIYEQCRKEPVNFGTKKCIDSFMHLENQLKIIELSLKREHPDITLDFLKDSIQLNELGDLSSRLSEVLGLGESDEEESLGNGKSQSKISTGQV